MRGEALHSVSVILLSVPRKGAFRAFRAEISIPNGSSQESFGN